MASCERCWSASYVDAYQSGESQAEAYGKLIVGHPCSPEDQAGEDAKVCQACDRRTVHQYAHVCMVCGAEEHRP